MDDEYWVTMPDGSLAPESAFYQKPCIAFKHIGKNVQIGSNVFFAHPELVEIGDNVRIDNNCSFTTAVKLGDYVHIGPFISVIGGVNSSLEMDNFSGLSAGCRIICASDDYFNGLTNPTIPEKYRPYIHSGKVKLHKHCIAGTNTVIHPNVKFAEGCCTGSMTLVTKSLEYPWMVYIGVPAKPYKTRNQEAIIQATAIFMRDIQ
jgi:acetyltransferase-like isoleucine patch superfamily enzyme